MKTSYRKHLGLILGTLAIPLALAAGGSARADDLDVTVKIFNYSKYGFTLTGNPVRFSDPSPFTAAGGTAPGKGKQTIISKPYILSKNGPASNDILLKLNVGMPNGPVNCFTMMTYSDIKGGSPGLIGIFGGTKGRIRLEVDPPKISCDGHKTPAIEWNQSGDDIEIVIDRKGWTWDD